MFFMYILRSDKTGRLYTGHTSDLSRRLAEHNSGMTTSTRHGAPWQLLYFETFSFRSQAMERERHLKTGKGRDEVKAVLAKADSNNSPPHS
jgi:putative endonuclease